MNEAEGKVVVNLARKLDESGLLGNARLAGATPLREWIGKEAATVFSY